jgi:lipopolysaccharide export system protein LptA
MKKWLLLLCAIALPAVAAPQNPVDMKHNSKLPIAIDANSLEVLQNENKAIFSGNVVAVQGDMTLKSDKMVVYYRQNGGAGKTKKAAAANAPAGAPNNISKIDVIGNVFISSPQETAQGDSGLYDVDKKLITLTGNVVLTKDKNVLKGNSAEYNVATGKSLMMGAETAGTPGGLPAGKGRVRGLFVPNQDKNKK